MRGECARARAARCRCPGSQGVAAWGAGAQWSTEAGQGGQALGAGAEIAVSRSRPRCDRGVPRAARALPAVQWRHTLRRGARPHLPRRSCVPPRSDPIQPVTVKCVPSSSRYRRCGLWVMRCGPWDAPSPVPSRLAREAAWMGCILALGPWGSEARMRRAPGPSLQRPPCPRALPKREEVSTRRAKTVGTRRAKTVGTRRAKTVGARRGGRAAREGGGATAARPAWRWRGRRSSAHAR